MLVPELSVQRDMVGPFLLIVNAEGGVESTYVELGPRHEDQRIIQSGLNAGDQVIVQGIQRARPGIQVQADTGTSGEGS
jgi:multidrug efflux pump subunit AcrA (membrane-fusion protein)